MTASSRKIEREDVEGGGARVLNPSKDGALFVVAAEDDARRLHVIDNCNTSSRKFGARGSPVTPRGARDRQDTETMPKQWLIEFGMVVPNSSFWQGQNRKVAPPEHLGEQLKSFTLPGTIPAGHKHLDSVARPGGWAGRAGCATPALLHAGGRGARMFGPRRHVRRRFQQKTGPSRAIPRERTLPRVCVWLRSLSRLLRINRGRCIRECPLKRTLVFGLNSV